MTALASRPGIAAEQAPGPDTSASDYRPELDGLRTVAVYAVVLFHAHVPAFPHGGIGVDVFFVLSGFLITRLLLVQLRSTGRLSLTRFFARRMCRLLPASWAALLLGAAALKTVMPPGRLSELDTSVRSALLWFANWHFVDTGTSRFRPFLHYWSLSLEEQFYLAWPLVLLTTAWLALRTRMGCTTVVLVLAASSAVAGAAWSFHLNGGDRAYYAYYATEARAYQLLGGAALAAWFVHRGVPGRRWTMPVGRMAQGVGLVALVALTTPWLDAGPHWRGLLTALATLAALAGMEADRRGPVARLLGTGPLAQLGRISYGTYLWHWVVAVLLGYLFAWNPWLVALVTTVLATGLAALSWFALEQPVRSSQWLASRPGTAVTAGLAISVALAVLVSGASTLL